MISGEISRHICPSSGDPSIRLNDVGFGRPEMNSYSIGDSGIDQLTHAFSLLPATSIRRPAATKSSAPLRESWAWSALRPWG